MASFIMLPNGVTGTNHWQNYGGATAIAAPANFDTGSIKLTTGVVGDGVTYVIVKLDPAGDSDELYGGKIFIKESGLL